MLVCLHARFLRIYTYYRFPFPQVKQEKKRFFNG